MANWWQCRGWRSTKVQSSPQFVINPEKLLVGFENAKVLVTIQKISSIKKIIPMLEKTMQLQAPLLTIHEDVTGKELAILAIKKLRGILNVKERFIVTGVVYQFKDLGPLTENASV